jgi:hypothetical protein
MATKKKAAKKAAPKRKKRLTVAKGEGYKVKAKSELVNLQMLSDDIVKALTESSLSAVAVSDMTGIPTTTFNEIKRGLIIPNVDSFARICTFLNTPIAKYFNL